MASSKRDVYFELRINRNLSRILCLMLFLQVLLSAMENSIVCSQPAVGDWVVTGEMVVENRTIVLNGGLIVEKGGSLTLRNVRLVMNCGYDGEFNIWVDEGSMYIYNSNITAADMEHRFAFNIGGDFDFVMRNSELHGCGWTGEHFESGLRLGLGAGLFFAGGGQAIVEDNKISNCWDGVHIWSAKARVVANNTISMCKWGIFLHGSQNSIIENNIIIGNEKGIEICGAGKPSERNIIIGNVITNNGAGIEIGGEPYGCSHNNITNNIIANNDRGLSLIEGSSGNIVYLNNFTGNTNQAQDNGINNSWDYDGKGNYWSGYDGWDEDGDGIGDTPYDINWNGVDHYPLGPTKSMISCKLAASSITEGESVNITGSIHPNPGSMEVTLEYSIDKGITWNKLASVITDADGRYSYLWSPDIGSYRIRAKWAGDWCYKAASSQTEELEGAPIISPTMIGGIAAVLIVAGIGGYIFLRSRKPAPLKPPRL